MVTKVETRTITAQPKWMSWRFWVALATLILLVIKLVTGYEIPVEVWDKILDAALTIGSAFGIWNDAGNKNEY